MIFLLGLFKGITEDNEVIFVDCVFREMPVTTHKRLAISWDLEGLGICGRLVEIMSTYPFTSPTPWHRIMAQKSEAKVFPSTLCF